MKCTIRATSISFHLYDQPLIITYYYSLYSENITYLLAFLLKNTLEKERKEVLMLKIWHYLKLQRPLLLVRPALTEVFGSFRFRRASSDAVVSVSL